MKEFIGRLVATIILVALCFFGVLCATFAIANDKEAGIATPSDATMTNATATDADAATATDANASIEVATVTDVTLTPAQLHKTADEIFADRTDNGFDVSNQTSYNKATIYRIEKKNDAYYVSSLSGSVSWYAPIVDKTKYASTDLYLREAPNMEVEPAIILETNEEVKVVGISENGWDLIDAGGSLYFAWGEFLVDEPIVIYTNTDYSVSYEGGSGYNHPFRSQGTTSDGSYNYTWYSQRALPGEGLSIPGRHVNEDGFVCDGDGRICVAIDGMDYGTEVDTPFGKAVVYDHVSPDGSRTGLIDVYTDW